MKDAKGPATLEPELDELRAILLGLDRDVLQALHQRVSNPSTRAVDVAEVLPEALARASKLPQTLGAVARPVIESALEASVRRDPTLVAELLFPVMGPAIRKSVSEALQAFMRSLNQGLEHSISLRSFKWRFEAWRTGKSFGEVVLRHTLRFRVEQVFLIHKETGLLLHNIVQPTLSVADADVVSSMLFAIQDFVQDSFRVEAGGALAQIEMDDLTIWIERGPRALVAAVVRGTAPVEYRESLARAVEGVHAKHSAALQQFDGETAPFEATEPLLAACLSEQLEESAAPSLWRAYVFAAIVLALVGGAAWWWIQERARWRQAVEALRNEPGIVVVSADQGLRRNRVAGLRDSYASDPALLLARAGFAPTSVDVEWRSFQSGDSAIAQRRAIDLLKPPPEAELVVREGVLRVSGRASVAWTADLNRLGRLIAGVEAIDTSELVDLDRLTLEEDRRQLSPFTVGFLGGVWALDGEALAGVQQYATRLLDLGRRAEQIDVRLDVSIVGASDTSGDPVANTALARRRAEFLRSVLAASGVASDTIRVDVLAPGATTRQRDATSSTLSRFATVTVQFAENARRP
jgi:OOP family OmpA-OmpF porin